MSSRIRLKSYKYLSYLSRNASTDVKDQVNTLINLYRDGKISQLQTAENLLFKLLNRDKKVQKSGINAYNKLVKQVHDKKPLSERLAAKRNAAIKQDYLIDSFFSALYHKEMIKNQISNNLVYRITF